jgi:hypothetical protein
MFLCNFWMCMYIVSSHQAVVGSVSTCVIRVQVKAAALETDGVEIYALSKTKVREFSVRLCYPVRWHGYASPMKLQTQT